MSSNNLVGAPQCSCLQPQCHLRGCQLLCVCRELGRHTYVTPTSYLELIYTYKELLGQQRAAVQQLRRRYEVRAALTALLCLLQLLNAVALWNFCASAWQISAASQLLQSRRLLRMIHRALTTRMLLRCLRLAWRSCLLLRVKSM
jgi:hypothetical protein